MKLIFSSYVFPLFINTIYKYCHAGMILYNIGKVYIPGHGHHISAFTCKGVNTRQKCSSIICKQNL